MTRMNIINTVNVISLFTNQVICGDDNGDLTDITLQLHVCIFSPYLCYYNVMFGIHGNEH